MKIEGAHPEIKFVWRLIPFRTIAPKAPFSLGGASMT
jgi:hypothetical protein